MGLPGLLKDWAWAERMYLHPAWAWTHGVALMPLPDRCAVKMSVGTAVATVRIFNRAIPGDIDSRAFYIEGYGGRKIEDRFSSPEIDLSKLRLEKYIQFYMPSENDYAKQ